MASKHPDPSRLSDSDLIQMADDYRRLSGFNSDRIRSNYHRYYFQCVGELISRGLWSRFEQWISRRARK